MRSKKAGYTGYHINSVRGNGVLGDKWEGDPRNIVFLENHNRKRGSYRNTTKGRLIDRQEMMNQSIKCKS